jgi:hypothetical protein
LKLHANTFFYVDAGTTNVEAKHMNAAAIRGLKSLQHFDSRGLAGSIGPQEPEYLARLNC